MLHFLKSYKVDIPFFTYTIYEPMKIYFPSSKIFWLLGILLVSVIGTYSYISSKTTIYESLLGFANNIYLKVLVYILLGIIVNFFLIPLGVFYKLLGGYLFGWKMGFVMGLVCTVAGSYTSFLFSNRFLDFQNDLIVGKAKRFSDKVKKRPLLTVIQLRLFPFFPLQMTNYLLSYLKLSNTNFFVGSLIGMAPASFVYAFLGHSLNTEIISDLQFSTILPIYFLLLGLLLLSLIFEWLKSR